MSASIGGYSSVSGSGAGPKKPGRGKLSEQKAKRGFAKVQESSAPADSPKGILRTKPTIAKSKTKKQEKLKSVVQKKLQLDFNPEVRHRQTFGHDLKSGYVVTSVEQTLPLVDESAASNEKTKEQLTLQEAQEALEMQRAKLHEILPLGENKVGDRQNRDLTEKVLSGRSETGITRASGSWSEPNMHWLYQLAKFHLAQKGEPIQRESIQTLMLSMAKTHSLDKDEVEESELRDLYYSIYGHKIHSDVASQETPGLYVHELQELYPIPIDEMIEKLKKKLKNIVSIEPNQIGGFSIIYSKISKKEIKRFLDSLEGA